MTESGLSRIFRYIAAICWVWTGVAFAQESKPEPAVAAPIAETASDVTPNVSEESEGALEPPATDPAKRPAAPTTKDVPSADAPSADIPSDAQMQAKGTRIGRIDIKVVDVFDPENPKESGVLYRFANFLHINTRESTVRPQLLFEPGAPYSKRLLDETARNLRDRRYLEDATITPIAYHPDTNTVDLLVRVHDVWTLNPGATLSHSGGVSRSGFEITESNLLGWGKELSIEQSKDVDRSSWEFGYKDPNLLSTRWTLDANYATTSDGGKQSLNIMHPFYSLDTKWSGGFDWDSDKRLEERFDQGEVVDQYRAERRTGGAQVGWSTGLRNGENNRPAWIQRLTAGYRMKDEIFTPDPELGTLVLPESRKLRYPWIGMTWFQDHYVVVRNRDKIARTEDLFIGRKVDLSIGFASKSSGSDRNATLITALAQDAYQFGERQFGLFKLQIDGRREGGRWQGTTFTGQLRYDVRQTAKALFVTILNHEHIENPDASQQLYLGSDEGMRGYPLRYRSGTGNTVLVLEQRIYTDKQILRLLSVAGAAFVDVGKVHGQLNTGTDGRSTFADIGFGLRLGNIRSSRGDMFHLDLAYPINATGEDRKIQYTVVTKATF